MGMEKIGGGEKEMGLAGCRLVGRRVACACALAWGFSACFHADSPGLPVSSRADSALVLLLRHF